MEVKPRQVEVSGGAGSKKPDAHGVGGWRHLDLQVRERKLDGAAHTYGFASKLDGKDSEVTGTGAPYGADHIAIKQQNSHMTSATLKKGDKVVGTSSATVSHDGKTLTLTSKGTDANGKATKTVSVYDKQ
jgi:hypothetical protein